MPYLLVPNLFLKITLNYLNQIELYCTSSYEISKRIRRMTEEAETGWSRSKIRKMFAIK